MIIRIEALDKLGIVLDFDKILLNRIITKYKWNQRQKPLIYKTVMNCILYS